MAIISSNVGDSNFPTRKRELRVVDSNNTFEEKITKIQFSKAKKFRRIYWSRTNQSS